MLVWINDRKLNVPYGQDSLRQPVFVLFLALSPLADRHTVAGSVKRPLSVFWESFDRSSVCSCSERLFVVGLVDAIQLRPSTVLILHFSPLRPC